MGVFVEVDYVVMDMQQYVYVFFVVVDEEFE